MDRQNHLFSLIAVFLALGIGILIGASMGENALVNNQIALIENLQKEIREYMKTMEEQHLMVKQLQEELLVWESMEEHYFNPLLLEDSLDDFSLNVLVLGRMPPGTEEFLRLSGCDYTIFSFLAVDKLEKWPVDEFEKGLDISGEKKGSALESIVQEELYKVFKGEKAVEESLIINFMLDQDILKLEREVFTPSLRVEKKKRIVLLLGETNPFMNGLIEKLLAEEEVVVHAASAVDSKGTENFFSVILDKDLDSFHGRFKLVELLKGA